MTGVKSASYQLKDAPVLNGGDRNRKAVSPIRQVASLWKTWVIVLVPIILLPVPLVYTSRAGRCAYTVMVMACYWMTEAIPMAVTALLPVVIMPWLGVLGGKELATNYLKDTNMLFFGGLVIAVAIERWNLHKRLSLRVLLLVGTKPRWLMFGFMVTTAFLSMWISNTATTAMMVPIAQAVIDELDKHRKSTEGSDNPGYEDEVGAAKPRDVAPTHVLHDVTDVSVKMGTEQVGLVLEETKDENNHKMSGLQMTDSDITEVELSTSEDTEEDKAFKEVCKGLKLCVAYAANIGGTATLTGTGPNLVMKGQVDTLYGGGTGINFSSWFIYSFPNMLVTLLFAWFWLQILFFGIKATFGCCCTSSRSRLNNKGVTQVIRDEYVKLGALSFAEVAVLIHFIVLALLWLTREPEFIPGWASIFPEYMDGFITDGTVAITVAVSLFIFPSKRPNFLCFRSNSDQTQPGPVPALLDWPTLEKRMAWGVVLVLGGGFALANACQKSGLSSAIGQAFIIFSDVPMWLLALILCAITAGFTEVTSNVATATIFLPILAELAGVLHINPLYLLVPVTVSTSFAFMLPVATPPNAIVFAYGNIRIWDMVKAGIVMNIACVLILQASINTWGYFYYDLGSYPAWANTSIAITSNIDLNSTLAQNCSIILGLTT